jgi:hypothetical protein
MHVKAALSLALVLLVLALAVASLGRPGAAGVLCFCHRLYSHLMLALGLLLLLLLGVWRGMQVLLLLKRMGLSALKTVMCA